MAITDIIEESSMIEAGAPSIKYEGERPLKKQEMLMAGPDWYIKRMELLMDEYGYDYDEAGEIAYDSDKYYEVIGIDPGGIGDESRIMDKDVIEEGIMRTAAANGGPAHRIQLVKRNKDGSRPGYYGADAGFGDDDYKDKQASFEKEAQARVDAGGHGGGSEEQFKRAREAVEKRNRQAAENEKKKKEQEKKDRETKQISDVQAKKVMDRRKKMGTKYVKDVMTDFYGDEISDEEKWDLQRFDTNRDGKLSLIEKNARLQSGLRDKALQKTVLTEMEKLGGANKGDIDFTKGIPQGGVHIGSGVPVDVWSKMTPKQKQYASVVQDYDINEIMKLDPSKETGHQKYTHGDLTYYSPGSPKTSYRTGAYPIVANPMIEHPLLMTMQPPPVQESALASLHRLGTAKAGMSNQKLGIEGMGYDEFEDFKVSNKNFPPDSGPDNEPSQDPCKGPNPPAYCFVGGKNQTDDEEEDDWMLGLAFRKDGGRVGRAFGGIMGDDGRRAYGLGSIFKKVKKIFKSPLGKAALLGLGGWKAGLFSGLGGGGGFLSGLKNMSLGKKAALTLGGGALAGMLAGQESQDEDGDGYDDKTGFPIQKYKDNPYDRHGDWRTGLAFAKDGGRIGYASGGDIADMSNDPEYRGWKLMYQRNKDVASMHPKHSDFVKYYQNVDRSNKAEGGLMDMGGMEMDLRDEGGFVPIGKKERADDVPARLSKNEFVFTADAVRGAGDGDIDKGAEIMYNSMKKLEAENDQSQGLDGAKEMFQTAKRLGEVI